MCIPLEASMKIDAGWSQVPQNQQTSLLSPHEHKSNFFGKKLTQFLFILFFCSEIDTISNIQQFIPLVHDYENRILINFESL